MIDVRSLSIRASDVPVRPNGVNANVFWMTEIKKLLDSFGVKYSTTGKFFVAFLAGSIDTRTLQWRAQGEKGVGYASLKKFLENW